MGYTVYDGLINWDLSSADKPSGLVPGLATSWKVDDGDKTRWMFTLRHGVKFHDGSDFKADAVVWNLDKLLNDKSPQYDSKQAAQGRSRIPSVKSYKALDDYTVEILTSDAGRLPALPDRLGHDVEPGAVGKGRPRLEQVRQDAVGHRAVEAHQLRAADARRARAQQGLLGQGARFPSSTSWSCCRSRKPRPAPRRCARARSTGSRRRRPMPCRASRRPASRSSPTPIRTTGPGISAASRARRGTTSACARRPISRSTATA